MPKSTTSSSSRRGTRPADSRPRATTSRSDDRSDYLEPERSIGGGEGNDEDRVDAVAGERGASSSRRGFAAMSPEQQRQLARRGGRASQARSSDDRSSGYRNTFEDDDRRDVERSVSGDRGRNDEVQRNAIEPSSRGDDEGADRDDVTHSGSDDRRVKSARQQRRGSQRGGSATGRGRAAREGAVPERSARKTARKTGRTDGRSTGRSTGTGAGRGGAKRKSAPRSRGPTRSKSKSKSRGKR